MTGRPSKFQIRVGLIAVAIAFAICIYLYRTQPYGKALLPMLITTLYTTIRVAYLIIKRYKMTIAGR